MTIRDLIQSAEKRLVAKGVPNARRNVEWMLGAVLGCTSPDLYVRSGSEVDVASATAFEDMVARRAAREPLQYILGTTEFMGLVFEVRRGVFIPRPDTECLVEHAERWLTANGRDGGEVLDLCSGSGVIAVSLAARLPGLRVTAVDEAREAVELTAANAYRNGVIERVGCFQAGAGAFLRGEVPRSHARGELIDHRPAARSRGDVPWRFDAILSNPPYIPAPALETLAPEIRHEPPASLDGGEDGLDFYRAVCPIVSHRLKPGGRVAFEIGAEQGQAVTALLVDAGLCDVGVLQDYAKLDRVVTGVLP